MKNIKFKLLTLVFIVFMMLSTIKAIYVVSIDPSMYLISFGLVTLYFGILVLFKNHLQTNLHIEKDSFIYKIRHNFSNKFIISIIIYGLISTHFAAALAVDTQKKVCLELGYSNRCNRNAANDNMLAVLALGFFLSGVLVLPEKTKCFKK